MRVENNEQSMKINEMCDKDGAKKTNFQAKNKMTTMQQCR